MQILLSPQQLTVTINRLAHQLVENYNSLADVVFIGIQPRGVKVSERIVGCLKAINPGEKIQYGILDITFYRDDIREEFHVASETALPFSIEGKYLLLSNEVD